MMALERVQLDSTNGKEGMIAVSTEITSNAKALSLESSIVFT